VQEAYGDLICAVAAHHPELLPARRYIETATLLLAELSCQQLNQVEAGTVAAAQQHLRILGGPCQLAAADGNVALSLAVWGLGEEGHCPSSSGTHDCRVHQEPVVYTRLAQIDVLVALIGVSNFNICTCQNSSKTFALCSLFCTYLRDRYMLYPLLDTAFPRLHEPHDDCSGRLFLVWHHLRRLLCCAPPHGHSLLGQLKTLGLELIAACVTVCLPSY
jgi:hypothetical protein